MSSIRALSIAPNEHMSDGESGSLELQLIDNEFVFSEAEARLMPLLNDQLSFYSLRNFSSQEHSGVRDYEASEKLEQIMIYKNACRSLLKLAAEQGKTVTLKASIELSIS